MHVAKQRSAWQKIKEREKDRQFRLFRTTVALFRTTSYSEGKPALGNKRLDRKEDNNANTGLYVAKQKGTPARKTNARKRTRRIVHRNQHRAAESRADVQGFVCDQRPSDQVLLQHDQYKIEERYGTLTEKLAWPTPTMTTLSGMLDAATKESIVWTITTGVHTAEEGAETTPIR